MVIMSFSLVFVLEIIGTVAFAISGATVGMRRNMDMLGVIILGMTTAVGGGVIRDLILGITPPATFRNPVYAIVAILVSIIIFLPQVRRFTDKKHPVLDVMLLIVDSVGLGVFTVVGIRAAHTASSEYTAFLLVFVGVITGVGGGVIRDVMAGTTPYIFLKHFYACASLIGAVICIVLWQPLGESAAMISGAVSVVILRLLAARFRWSLPK